MRYVRAARDAGLRRAVVSSSTQLPRRARGRRHRGPVRGARRRRRRRSASTCAASRRRTPISPARGRSASTPAQRGGVRGRARRRRRRAAPAASAASSASTASARPQALRAHGADVVVSDLAELLEPRDPAPGVLASSRGRVRETELDLDVLAQTESVFALSNGHIGLRGNLDEGEPHGLPGTYLNGFYELRPLPYAEAGYGYPGVRARRSSTSPTASSSGCSSTTSRSTSATASCAAHERVLDLRAGMLRRTRGVGVAGADARARHARRGWCRSRSARSRRSATRSSRSTARTPVVVQSELVANEQLPPREARPARRGRARDSPLRSELTRARATTRGVLVHRTKRERAAMAAAMDHVIDGPRAQHRERGELRRHRSRGRRRADLGAGRAAARSSSSLAYGWSRERSTAGAARPGRRRAGRGAPHAAGTACSAEQRAYLDDFWERADVEIEGDAELQQAVRFALFHVLQAGARAERRAIAAKGLTGPGYDGHAFWDTETFVLPVLTYTVPARGRATRCAGATRRSTSRASAPRSLGLEGAAFPWRTIHGEECSGYWPAGTAAFHVNADIADAVAPLPGASDRRRGVRAATPASSCWSRRRGCGARSGHHDARRALPHRRRHRARRVQRDRRQQRLHEPDGASGTCAAPPTPCERHPTRRASSASTHEEMAAWRAAAERDARPLRRAARRALRRREGFTEHEPWDFDATAPDQYPLLLHFPYFDLYRKQVVKQADLVLALHLCGDAFTRRAEGAQLRLLRAAHRARLVAVGVHAGGHRRRGRPPRARATTTSPRRR